MNKIIESLDMNYSIIVIDSYAKYEQLKQELGNIYSEYLLSNFISMKSYYKDPNYICQLEYGVSYDIIVKNLTEENKTGILPEKRDLQWKKFFSIPSSNIFLLLEVDEQIKGEIGYEKINQTTAMLIRFYIKPEFRGNNFGNLLLNKLLELVRENGYKEIKLQTYPFHTALPLYLKAGFDYCDYFTEVGSSEEVEKIAESIYMRKIIS